MRGRDRGKGDTEENERRERESCLLYFVLWVLFVSSSRTVPWTILQSVIVALYSKVWTQNFVIAQRPYYIKGGLIRDRSLFKCQGTAKMWRSYEFPYG